MTTEYCTYDQNTCQDARESNRSMFLRIAAFCFLIATFALCAFTGKELSPGELSLRNLICLIVAFKMLTWADNPTVSKSFLFWIGMNVREFNSKPPTRRYQINERIRGVVEIVLGFALIAAEESLRAHTDTPLIVLNWMKLIGMTSIYYFGCFRLLACFFQWRGRGARALMKRPLSSKKLPEFWSRRWNRAFPFIMRTYIYGPIKKHTGPTIALFAAFLFSGFLHELIISVPVGAGYGLPTLYFVIQAIGICIVRSRVGRKIRLNKGFVGWAFAMLWIAMPLPLLFHTDFILRVV